MTFSLSIPPLPIPSIFPYFGGDNNLRTVTRHHRDILALIRKHAPRPEASPFLDNYLGNTHPKYPITNPILREIARDWMRNHRDVDVEEFKSLLTSLIEGKSCTEKMMAGFLMEYASKSQRTFDPAVYSTWLDHLDGWVEVDTLCTGDFIATQLHGHWPKWKRLITTLSKDPDINKRRASLVLFCSPLGRTQNDDIATTALKIVDRLKAEKDVRITKAVSWVLRSLIKHHRDLVTAYLDENESALPRIAVRETFTKLVTGTKGGKTRRP